MKKQTTKMLALILLAAMMLTAFTACGAEKAPDTSSTQPAAQAEAPAAATAEEPKEGKERMTKMPSKRFQPSDQ